jgi:3-hydroxy-9,10-secoandrosta-1,3,5(10)-triene-9,17-dione monooxygenase
MQWKAACQTPEIAMTQTADPITSEITREAVLQRAEAMLPVLRERADMAEEQRRLPEVTVRDFHDAGLFRIIQPKRVGGYELDYGMMYELGAVVSRACASSGWNVSNLACHHWMLGMWPKAAQDEVWGRNNETSDALICASVIFPAGKAKRVDGGYVLSGYWPFCSGIDPSDWNMLGGMVAPDDDHPAAEPRLFLVRKSDHELIDTWYTSGLQGTGSKDARATDLFVPEHMTVSGNDIKGGPTPGSAVNPGALFQVPVIAPFAYVLSGTPLGVAQGVLEQYVGGMRDKVANYSGNRIAELQNIQIKVAEAAAAVEAAELIMRSDCDESMAIAGRGVAPDLLTKAKYRRNGAFSANLCAEAVSKVFKMSGGGGIYSRNPISRSFRDIHAACAHIAFNMDVAGTTYGRIALGLESDNMTL